MTAESFEASILFTLYETSDDVSKVLMNEARAAVAKVTDFDEIINLVDLGAGTGRLVKPWAGCQSIRTVMLVEGTPSDETVRSLKATMQDLAAKFPETKYILQRMNYFEDPLEIPPGLSMFLMNPCFDYCKKAIINFFFQTTLIFVQLQFWKASSLRHCEC
jgi:predicted RNA methylase